MLINKRRAEEIIERELAVAPELVPIFEALMQARRDILARIAALDSRIRAIAKCNATVRLLMTAPGVGPITAIVDSHFKLGLGQFLEERYTSIETFTARVSIEV